MDREDLLKLIGEDDLGLLAIKNKATAEVTSQDRLVKSFSEINNFVKKTGREPKANKSDVQEMKLFSRLVALRQDEAKMNQLKASDELGLLFPQKKIESITDVFSDDDLGLLEKDPEDIFVLKNVPSKEIANLPDYVARRKPCDDFEQFSALFKECHRELTDGKRTLMPFKRGSLINKTDFFLLKGMLVYVADEGARHQTADRNTFNARLRCIFENGTESDMLLRSLAAALYKEDGRRVSYSTDKLVRTVNDIQEDDRETGYVYILRSLNERKDIKSLKHLYKIGYSKGLVEDRIKNASIDPTYLMAPVAIVTAFKCFNLNPQKLEHLLHSFFGKACLQIEIIDNDGNKYTPKEWFIAPLAVITKAIELLISGEIVDYRYNPETQNIDLR